MSLKLVDDLDLAKVIISIEATFKNFSYSDIQRQIIKRHMKQLSLGEATKLAEDIAMMSSKPPKPIEIAEAVKAKIKDRNRYEYVVEAPRDVECVECYETGFNFVIHDNTKTLCLCSCKFGKRSDFPTIPRFDYKHMNRIEFPLKQFKPRNNEIKNLDQSEIVAWWNMQKEIANQYWVNI